jgi:hypothetical protein
MFQNKWMECLERMSEDSTVEWEINYTNTMNKYVKRNGQNVWKEWIAQIYFTPV